MIVVVSTQVALMKDQVTAAYIRYAKEEVELGKVFTESSPAGVSPDAFLRGRACSGTA